MLNYGASYFKNSHYSCQLKIDLFAVQKLGINFLNFNYVVLLFGKGATKFLTLFFNFNNFS